VFGPCYYFAGASVGASIASSSGSCFWFVALLLPFAGLFFLVAESVQPLPMALLCLALSCCSAAGPVAGAMPICSLSYCHVLVVVGWCAS
jgi:hypothetical protein